MLPYLKKLSDEIDAVAVTPEDESREYIGKNDTLIGDLPKNLRKLCALKSRATKAYKNAEKERGKALSLIVCDKEGRPVPGTDPKLINSFWLLNKQASPLMLKSKMLNALFEMALHDHFADCNGCLLEVCNGWKVVLRGEKDR